MPTPAASTSAAADRPASPGPPSSARLGAPRTWFRRRSSIPVTPSREPTALPPPARADNTPPFQRQRASSVASTAPPIVSPRLGPRRAKYAPFRRTSVPLNRAASAASASTPHASAHLIPAPASAADQPSSPGMDRSVSAGSASGPDAPGHRGTSSGFGFGNIAAAAARLLGSDGRHGSSRRTATDGVVQEASPTWDMPWPDKAPPPADPGSDHGERPLHTFRLVPELDGSARGARVWFDPIEREVEQDGESLQIGRFTDRDPFNPSLFATDTTTAEHNEATVTRQRDEADSSSRDESRQVSRPVAAPPPPSLLQPRRMRGGAIPNTNGNPPRMEQHRAALSMKVVSRKHIEIWCTSDPPPRCSAGAQPAPSDEVSPFETTRSVSPLALGADQLEALGQESASSAQSPALVSDSPSPRVKWWIRDLGSSAGTFVNHVRLSRALTPSGPTELHEGDIIKLGVNYVRGVNSYQAVRMRVEMHGLDMRSEYAAQARRRLAELQGAENAMAKSEAAKDGKQPTAVAECCICLFGMTVSQSLFIAPCSHSFHYKCIRPLLMRLHPGFCCPLCRSFADLDAEVDFVEFDCAPQSNKLASSAQEQVSASPRSASAPFYSDDPSPSSPRLGRGAGSSSSPAVTGGTGKGKAPVSLGGNIAAMEVAGAVDVPATAPEEASEGASGTESSALSATGSDAGRQSNKSLSSASMNSTPPLAKPAPSTTATGSAPTPRASTSLLSGPLPEAETRALATIL